MEKIKYMDTKVDVLKILRCIIAPRSKNILSVKKATEKFEFHLVEH